MVKYNSGGGGGDMKFPPYSRIWGLEAGCSALFSPQDT